MQLFSKALGVVAAFALAAVPAAANDAGVEIGDLACGTLVPVETKTELEAAEQCSCSGGVTLEITAVGTYTAEPGSLVCESVNIKNGYDGVKAGGNTLLRAERFIHDERIDRSCDTSDCWWFWPLSGGTPVCSENHIVLQGGHTHYVAVGTCPETPPSDDSDDEGEPPASEGDEPTDQTEG